MNIKISNAVMPMIRSLIGSIDPIERRYTQWTIDWVDSFGRREEVCDDKTDLEALEYEVDNILAMMKEDIPDAELFRVIKMLIFSLNYVRG